MAAGAGSGAAVHGSPAPEAAPGPDRLFQQAGRRDISAVGPLFSAKGVSAAGVVLPGPGGGAGGTALAGVAL